MPLYTTNFTLAGVNPVNTISNPLRPEGGTDEATIFERSTCDTLGAQPPTPSVLTPDVVTYRQFQNIQLDMPDGKKVRFWVLHDTDSDHGPVFPSPLLRYREGQVVHSSLDSSHQLHSIHHHGLEPEPFNDGVGHVSFEAASYTYQFVLREGSAGTYFYHCHRNTTLHFEMGMFGMLIVDPPEGPGRLYTGGPEYDKEYLWAVDDVNGTYRSISSGSGDFDGQPENMFGMQCNDPEDAFWGLLNPTESAFAPFMPGMSEFKPQYFHINGIFAPTLPNAPVITDPSVAPVAAGGERVLLRLLNSAFTTIQVTFGLPCQVLAMDARPLGGYHRNPKLKHTKYSRPFTVPAGQPITLSTARRWDLMFTPRVKGEYPIEVLYKDWITGEVLGEIQSKFTVTSSAPIIPPLIQPVLFG